MYLRKSALLVAAVLVLEPALGAAEKSWFGKIDLAEKAPGRSIRFFAHKDGLSLFARGDFKTILLQGYYAKARMSVGYSSIECPSGITGPCGRVNFVSVDQGNNF